MPLNQMLAINFERKRKIDVMSKKKKAKNVESKTKLSPLRKSIDNSNMLDFKNDQEWLNHVYKTRSPLGLFSEKHANQKLFVTGWAMRYRDQGGCIFVDLRDRSGLLQLVFDLDKLGANFHLAESLRSEFVLAIEGTLRLRTKDNINSNIPTGKVELLVERFLILNISQTPSISLEDFDEVSEELGLKYRFLELRRKDMNESLQMRSKLNHELRNFLHNKGFTEVETPILNKATPEGARDFLVPSRLNSGRFYALPQSPQIFKQVLMVSGCEKYFQIAKCFRDEALRADRQPEFTQLDLEMSFVNPEIVMQTMEELWVEVFEKCFGIKMKTPIAKMTYFDAMERYGVDAPDLRYEMPLCDIAEFVPESDFQVFKNVLAEGGRIKALRVPNGAKLSRKEIEDLTAWVSNDYNAKGLAWVKHEAEGLHSVISKFFKPELLQKIAKHCKSEIGDIIFFGAGPENIVHATLGNLRKQLAKTFKMIPDNVWNFVWIYDFPLFVRDPQTQAIESAHNPFTAPLNDDLHLLMDKEIFEKSASLIRSQAYDLVLNGCEIGGGSIRINKSEIQEKVFEYLGLKKEQINEQFGFFLNALKYGAPPHGGIAFGLDRILMLCLKRESIREVIAFPKTQKGQCLFSEAPGTVEISQLRDLHIKLA